MRFAAMTAPTAITRRWGSAARSLNLSPAPRANNTKRQRLPAGEREVRCPRPTGRRCAIGMPRTCSRAFRECIRQRSHWAQPWGAAVPTTWSPACAFAAAQVLPILGEAAAVVEPGNGAFDNPAPRPSDSSDSQSLRTDTQAEVSSRMRVMIAKDIDICSLGVLLSQNRWRLRFARHCFRKCRKLLPIASKLPAMVFARLGRKQQPRRLHGWFFELNRKQL